MRTSIFTILTATLVLSACGATGTSISEQNTNPITASRYGEELADRMADLVIQKDPILSEPGMEEYVNAEIEKGKKIAEKARDIQDRGMMGPILPMKQTVLGYALYVDDTLYLSSDFQSDPGSALHLYLTTVVDPRDGTFPDQTAIDLGVIQSQYGPSSYAVPHQDKPELYRTLVFYETKLKRLYGFAQLSMNNAQ